MNAIGVALVGAAFVFPVIRDDNPSALLEWRTWIWILLGFIAHQAGTTYLGRMKRED